MITLIIVIYCLFFFGLIYIESCMRERNAPGFIYKLVREDCREYELNASQTSVGMAKDNDIVIEQARNNNASIKENYICIVKRTRKGYILSNISDSLPLYLFKNSTRQMLTINPDSSEILQLNDLIFIDRNSNISLAFRE